MACTAIGDTDGMTSNPVPFRPASALSRATLAALAMVGALACSPSFAQPAPSPVTAKAVSPAASAAPGRPELQVVRLRVSATLLGAHHGAAWLEAENRGDAADRLLRASTTAAARVELHDMAMDDKGVMRMREVEGGIPVPARGAVRMKPGMGHHLMLMDLKKPLKEGDVVPFVLEFERAGKVEAKGTVDAPRGQAAHRY